MQQSGDDLALVQSVIRGDEGAYQQLNQQIDRIVESCLAKVRARAPWIHCDEPDLKQKFGLLLLENDHRVLRSYEGRSALTTWVHVVATRYFQRQASQLRRERDALVNDSTDELPDSNARPDAVHAERSAIERVRSALVELEAQDQALLAFLFEQGMSAHEVAPLLGLTPSGVRMRKARLLKKLSKRLGGSRP